MWYLFAAYVAIWCLLFIYLVSLKSRTKSLESRVEALAKKVQTP